MILRIDDYNSENSDKIFKIISLCLSIFPNLKILIWVIILESDIDLLKKLLEKYNKNIFLAFHWYIHQKSEFLKSEQNQELCFLKAEEFFQKLNYKNRYFIPPFNKFNNITIYLLKKYNYNYFSLNYKDFKKNREILESNFNIIETNYFFNKKKNNWEWYTDNKEEIIKEVQNLKVQKVNLWIEVHPQYILNQEDIDKFIFLINYIKNEN